MSFNAGEMVGPYRIVEQLGQGGMATVYKAYHAALDRYVALKVLHPAFTEDTSFLARFQREARLVAKLDHPNIVPIFDYAEHEGRPYLVMKFIEGVTLKARMGTGPLSPTDTARVVDAVGAALAYAHQRGILHRDIKPSNVLLANDGGIYLADFGLARIAASGESTLSTDMVMGTPQYISPEQAMGKKELDEGTDIYSFGVMLYEMVVGKVPFSADTPFSIIHDHIYTPLPMPRQVNPLVSPEVERVLLKALAKERSDRYRDVHALVDAFQQAWQATGPTQRVEPISLRAEAPTLAGVPVQATQLPAAEAAATVLSAGESVAETAAVPRSDAKPKKKFPWMWLAVGVVLLLACMVTAASLWSVRRNRLLSPSAPISTQPAAATPGSTGLPQPSQLVEASGPTPAPPGIGPALAQVTQQPNDPAAYVQLAIAYNAADENDLAEQQITVIEKLGPPEAVLWQESIKLAGQGAWLPAARLRLDAAEMHLATSASLTPDLNNLLARAVYLAFKQPDAPNYINYDRLGKIDDALAQIAKARFTFYNQDKNAGQTILDNLLKTRPDVPEAQLLQAEFAAKLGKPDAARLALANLNKNPRTTDWMRALANSIKGALP
jgi:tRNA A-37 threonylcarbamoyl transferase component Bud32